MPAKYFDIDLDIKDPKIRMIPYIEVVSGDTGTNVFNIQLFENFVPVNASGYTAVITFGKPDKTTVFQNLIPVDVTKGKYTCTLSSQTIAAAGIVRAEVSLYEGTKRLTSNRFEFRVRKPILDDDTIESSNEFSALTQALSTVQEYDAHLDEFETLLSENAIMHNNIYRGKYLGSSVTPEQYQAISSGTFEDLYIGDYWSINGVNYRIAGFDYYYNTGDTACTTHHAVIVPDTVLYTHPMNDTNTTTGGYVGSKMYTDGLTQAKTTIKSAFSGHVLNHRKILSNATSNGKASGWAWFDSEVELMTEPMVYGFVVWGGSGYNIGVDKSQLPLFKLNPRMINTRQTYWLRDVVSGSDFARVLTSGSANSDAASNANGVRPAFSIS